ncbi:PKD domain-containing protein, partial [Candidatus Bathyarchaeota archaeon]
ISPTGTLTNPGAIAHTEQAATFEDTTIFDPTALGWHASFAFTPNPPVPGSSLKFTATVSCGLCTAPFNFAWDTNSDGLTEGGGTVNPFTVTPPPPIVNRVTLTVGDAAAHSVTLVQLVPFAVTLTGPASLALNATGTYNGLWLGGSPTYSGTFRLCSGAPSTQLRVCTNPNPAVAGTALQTSTQSNIYRFSGLYTNKLTITTTASGGVPATSVTATLLTNVTGTKPAFSVVAAGNMSSVQVNHPITYTGTASYAGGFNGYPAYSRSGDSLINGTAPALGTVMHSDTRIVFVDVATGGQGTTANNLWDPSEWIFFCSGVAPGGACTTVPATGAFVLYQGIGTRPAAATITKRDAHIDCVCTNNAFAQGQVVIYDYDSTNAAAGVPYDVFLSFTFLFGDGTQTQVSASGTTPSGGFTATTSHSYISPGPVSPKVIVQETGTPSGTPQIGPLSAIVEQGFTGTITVTPPSTGITVNVTCGSATAGKPVTCNATATGGNGGPYTFTWTAPSGSPSTGSGPSFTTTYAVKGTFQVTANATDTASNKGSASVMVTVAPQPIVVTVTCGSATAGKPVTCNASATGGTTPFTFSWSAPGGSPATGTGASFTTPYAAKGTFVVNATATDNNGAKKSQTAIIVVAGQPLQATISAACVNALATVTVGKPVTCSATASGGTGPYTFRWTAVGGSPASGTGASFTVSYATKGTFTLTVNATDANNRSAATSVTNFVVSGQP